jgi:hypothetical protein
MWESLENFRLVLTSLAAWTLWLSAWFIDIGKYFQVALNDLVSC